MTRLPALCTAVVALACVPLSPALAASPFDAVTGGYGIGASTNTISAHAGPNGAKGMGATNIRGQGRVFTADVVCVNAVGHRASVELFAEGAGYIAAYYEDNGAPGNSAPDRVGNGPAFSPVPQGCPDPDAFFAIFGVPVESGNIVVRDGA
jgi:hypothetical protein